MVDVVLVHGGWHGGWCWRRLAPRLRAAGHAVWAPTLSGLGDRAHLLTRETGLATHVEDVAALLAFEDLRGAVLVGHSYGGMVVGGVAVRAADRLAGLVFLDAFVPEAGRSLLEGLPAARRDHFLAQARERGDGWRVPPPAPEVFGIADSARARWVAARLTDQPLRAFAEPAVGDGGAAPIPRAYVRCTGGPLTPSFAPFAERIRGTPGWASFELATGHDAMLTAPDELAAILLGFVADAAGGAG